MNRRARAALIAATTISLLAGPISSAWAGAWFFTGKTYLNYQWVDCYNYGRSRVAMGVWLDFSCHHVTTGGWDHYELWAYTET